MPCCYQYFKDTNWKQITTANSIVKTLAGCYQYFKDTNWKQITTITGINPNNIKLLSIFQRYKLKANHNNLVIVTAETEVVINISKIQIESKSQLLASSFYSTGSCYQYFKDTNWKQITTKKSKNTQKFLLLSIFQRYKLKANHNWLLMQGLKKFVVINISKIQIESKSQLPSADTDAPNGCYQYFKDTNWKQITTHQQ